jgi:outer membrane immunogenic protein
MRNSRALLLATASTLAFATSASAQNWSGFYAGLNLGAGVNRAQFSETGTATYFGNGPFWSPNPSTFAVGGQIGFNWQVANFVYGIEADLSRLGAKTNATFLPNPFGGAIDARTNLDWLGSVRGRFGVAFSSALIYVTAGVAVGHYSDNWQFSGGGDGPFTANATRASFIGGAGVEFMVARNWSFRVEGLYANLGSSSDIGRNTCGGGYRTRFEHVAQMYRGALSFRW